MIKFEDFNTMMKAIKNVAWVITGLIGVIIGTFFGFARFENNLIAQADENSIKIMCQIGNKLLGLQQKKIPIDERVYLNAECAKYDPRLSFKRKKS